MKIYLGIHAKSDANGAITLEPVTPIELDAAAVSDAMAQMRSDADSDAYQLVECELEEKSANAIANSVLKSLATDISVNRYRTSAEILFKRGGYRPSLGETAVFVEQIALKAHEIEQEHPDNDRQENLAAAFAAFKDALMEAYGVDPMTWNDD